MNGLDHAACWTCLERLSVVTWLLTQRKTIHPSTTAATHTHPANRTAHANPFPFTFPSPFLSFPLIHLPIYQQHPPYPSLPPSLPLPLFPIPPTHSFIYPIPSIRPSVQSNHNPAPQEAFHTTFFFFFFVKKGSIDRAGCLRVCVCLFSCFFLGLGSLFLCLVLSCRRYVTLRYGTVNRREVGLEWVGEWLGV